MHVDIELPPLSYFETHNVFTGSQNQIFRFHVDTNETEILADVWNEDICFELAQNTEQKNFPLTEEGRVATKAWIEEQFMKTYPEE